jgi:hypothetical protein
LFKLCSPALYLKHKVGAKSSTSCRSESSNISLAVTSAVAKIGKLR